MTSAVELLAFVLDRIDEQEVTCRLLLALPTSVLYGPARQSLEVAFAECGAKRRRIGLLLGTDEVRDHLPEVLLDEGADVLSAMAEGVVILLKIDAFPFVDHPDYRDEWRPIFGEVADSA